MQCMGYFRIWGAVAKESVASIRYGFRAIYDPSGSTCLVKSKRMARIRRNLQYWFDNFLNVKCPDEAVLRALVRRPWWRRPTSVQGETDPRIAEMAEKGTIERPKCPAPEKVLKSKPSLQEDALIEKQYREDCFKITKAIEPLEEIQLQFLLMLLDNTDGTNMVPSTRKIFLEKFRRYIMDNCILDMKGSKRATGKLAKKTKQILPTKKNNTEDDCVYLYCEDINSPTLNLRKTGSDVKGAGVGLTLQVLVFTIKTQKNLFQRLFNISRNSPAISWCCHARLLSAVLRLQRENPLGKPNVPPHIPTRTFIDGELDFYNVDRLGGVLPFLVRTLRKELIEVLGEDNPFIQSFEPSYNRAGGVDAGISSLRTLTSITAQIHDLLGVSDMPSAGSPGLATLPQVISSMARFMHPQTLPMQNRPTGETALALKGTRSVMPGAGNVDARHAHLRLVDGLLALYHGTAVKHAEKLCELRDNQLDMADCLHDIENRILAVSHDLSTLGKDQELTQQDQSKKLLMERMLAELEMSRSVYEEKLDASALQMSWVIGAVWTGRRQAELATHFAGALHSLRLASDSDYVAHHQSECQQYESLVDPSRRDRGCGSGRSTTQ
ncbi:unnamed protein product [Plutella xylostella]|uniref:(diamondback moth) hypothetical protein n=1 Tax=Plutella xylostella TaxID=51655 RepID=A0A8S4F981_PLUXY|nr:unnamed protein product [Plutella xylostella]